MLPGRHQTTGYLGPQETNPRAHSKILPQSDLSELNTENLLKMQNVPLPQTREADSVFELIPK